MINIIISSDTSSYQLGNIIYLAENLSLISTTKSIDLVVAESLLPKEQKSATRLHTINQKESTGLKKTHPENISNKP